MQFEIYQWLVPMIGLFYIARTIYHFSQKRRSITGLVVWLMFWSSVIVLVLVPNYIATSIAKILGFKDVVNAVIFVAIGLLFLFIFYLSSTVERLERQLTTMVRNIALEEVEEEERAKVKKLKRVRTEHKNPKKQKLSKNK